MDSQTITASWTWSLVTASLLALPATTSAEWMRFRGPHGSGVSGVAAAPPIAWSGQHHLKWKVALPGPGLSSPIVVGSRVLVTCWSGYGVDRANPGNLADLQRHLVCFDSQTGRQLWKADVPAAQPEDAFRGMFTENGYASHTPASDGEHVFVFFGKSGALAFDLEGNQIWQTVLGNESDPRGWGSASSPIVHDRLLIVTAAAESEAIVALDKRTGREVWRQEAAGFNGTWGTPLLVELPDGRAELVLAVPYEIWGLNPKNGKLRWFCKGLDSNSICTSVVADGGIVYAIGGREGGAIAVRAGGTGDVSDTHVLWRREEPGRIGTPVLHDGRLHWITRQTAYCLDASTGDRLYRERLRPSRATGPGEDQRVHQNPSGEDAPSAERGFRRGGRGGQDYSSPVAAGNAIYYLTRSGDAYVLALGPEFRQLAHNRLGEDLGEFSASPAVSGGELFVRSSKFLFCVAE